MKNRSLYWPVLYLIPIFFLSTAMYWPDCDEKLSEEDIDLFHAKTAKYLKALKQRDNQNQIRNGDLGKALIAMRNYQTLAKEQQKQAAKSLLVALKGNDATDKISLALEDYKLQFRKVLETEAIIQRQKAHFPILFDRLNALQNTNGQALRIYIFSHKQLPVASWGNHYNALTVMAKANGYFTSDTPSLRQLLPKLKKCNNAIAVHIVFNQPGKTLSHEFGHILYLYHNWEKYQEFIKVKGEKYKFGGHSPDDPNGLAADTAEQGQMPDTASGQ